MIEVIGLFLVAAVSECIWVIWDRGIDLGRPYVVAASAMALMAVGILTVRAAVLDWTMAIPAILGTGAGALVGMRLPWPRPPGSEESVP